MIRALLIGKEPPVHLGCSYVNQAPYEKVVIGSLSLGELLCFQQEEVFDALAGGVPVVLYTGGLPTVPHNRALAASLASAQRQLKSWGVVFTDGHQKKLITAEEARMLKRAGKTADPGAVLTPLAREILEG